MSDGTKAERKTVPFVAWLESHKTGEVDNELTYHLRELIQAVQDTGKKGTLTFSITVNRKGERQVVIDEDVKVKLPQHDRSESIYFVDGHLNLTRTDPGQQVFNLSEMRGGRAAGSDGDQ